LTYALTSRVVIHRFTRTLPHLLYDDWHQWLELVLLLLILALAGVSVTWLSWVN